MRLFKQHEIGLAEVRVTVSRRPNLLVNACGGFP
jgi:hypothetical protein